MKKKLGITGGSIITFLLENTVFTVFLGLVLIYFIYRLTTVRAGKNTSRTRRKVYAGWLAYAWIYTVLQWSTNALLIGWMSLLADFLGANSDQELVLYIILWSLIASTLIHFIPTPSKVRARLRR